MHFYSYIYTDISVALNINILYLAIESTRSSYFYGSTIICVWATNIAAWLIIIITCVTEQLSLHKHIRALVTHYLEVFFSSIEEVLAPAIITNCSTLLLSATLMLNSGGP